MAGSLSGALLIGSRGCQSGGGGGGEGGKLGCGRPLLRGDLGQLRAVSRSAGGPQPEVKRWDGAAGSSRAAQGRPYPRGFPGRPLSRAAASSGQPRVSGGPCGGQPAVTGCGAAGRGAACTPAPSVGAVRAAAAGCGGRK